jgi:hypothetical protein
VHEKGCPGNSILEAAVASVCGGIALSRGISSWLVSNIAKFETRISAVWTESSLSIEFPGVLLSENVATGVLEGRSYLEAAARVSMG